MAGTAQRVGYNNQIHDYFAHNSGKMKLNELTGTTKDLLKKPWISIFHN
jgi:hypothetical protein